MTANGAAERLERLTEMKRQAPDSHGIYADPSQQGVTVAWLAQVFELDQTVVKKKLRFCKPLRIKARGKTMQTVYYDIKEAARFLVVPEVSTADVLRELKNGQLPQALQNSVWDALLKRQTWEERAGQLWRTEKVREVLGTTFQTIKFTTQLWAETVERQTALSQEQRALIVEMSDALLAEIYGNLVKNAQEGFTGPQVTEIDDLTGERTRLAETVDLVEDEEDFGGIV